MKRAAKHASSSSGTFAVFQGGQIVEVLSNVGSQLQASVGTLAAPKTAKRIFDNSVKSFIVAIEGTTQSTNRIVFEDLKLLQRFLCFQLLSPAANAPVYLELSISDAQSSRSSMNRRRLLFSSAFSKMHVSPLHVQIPLLPEAVPRQQWLALIIDWPLWVQEAWGYGSCAGWAIETITVGPSCRIRKIFSMRDDPRLSEIPKVVQFSPSVPWSLLVVSPQSMLTPHVADDTASVSSIQTSHRSVQVSEFSSGAPSASVTQGRLTVPSSPSKSTVAVIPEQRHSLPSSQAAVSLARAPSSGASLGNGALQQPRPAQSAFPELTGLRAASSQHVAAPKPGAVVASSAVATASGRSSVEIRAPSSQAGALSRNADYAGDVHGEPSPTRYRAPSANAAGRVATGSYPDNVGESVPPPPVLDVSRSPDISGSPSETSPCGGSSSGGESTSGGSSGGGDRDGLWKGRRQHDVDVERSGTSGPSHAASQDSVLDRVRPSSGGARMNSVYESDNDSENRDGGDGSAEGRLGGTQLEMSHLSADDAGDREPRANRFLPSPHGPSAGRHSASADRTGYHSMTGAGESYRIPVSDSNLEEYDPSRYVDRAEDMHSDRLKVENHPEVATPDRLDDSPRGSNDKSPVPLRDRDAPLAGNDPYMAHVYMSVEQDSLLAGGRMLNTPPRRSARRSEPDSVPTGVQSLLLYQRPSPEDYAPRGIDAQDPVLDAAAFDDEQSAPDIHVAAKATSRQSKNAKGFARGSVAGDDGANSSAMGRKASRHEQPSQPSISPASNKMFSGWAHPDDGPVAGAVHDPRSPLFVPGGSLHALSAPADTGNASLENADDQVELIFDPILRCYYDPKSGKYYEAED